MGITHLRVQLIIPEFSDLTISILKKSMKYEKVNTSKCLLTHSQLTALGPIINSLCKKLDVSWCIDIGAGIFLYIINMIYKYKI
jgi:hypothetical protein